jgi:hypothetical protein
MLVVCRLGIANPCHPLGTEFANVVWRVAGLATDGWLTDQVHLRPFKV